MSEDLSPEIKIMGINQVAIVVKDVKSVAENFWKILGIGPWEIWSMEEPNIFDGKYYGQPSKSRFKIALTRIGAVQIELIEHLDGKTIYNDFLKKQGEGLNHLNFIVDDATTVFKIAEILASKGFPSIQSARTAKNSAFNYIDIDPLHAIWEVVHPPDKRKGEPVIVPDKNNLSNRPIIQVKGIDRVGFVVKDVAEVAQNYQNILNVREWEYCIWKSPLVHNRYYHSKLAPATDKIAVSQLGSVQLKLCQPSIGPSIFQDIIDKKGQGFHFISFEVDNTKDTVEKLLETGFNSLESGCIGEGGYFHYFEIPPLRIIWEVLQEPL
ncbi:VOC family protein [Chloroflexota bacterium]